ncbi:MAG: hypothetical protein WCL50_05550 [Spirochaetota bacterium]
MELLDPIDGKRSLVDYREDFAGTKSRLKGHRALDEGRGLAEVTGTGERITQGQATP